MAVVIVMTIDNFAAVVEMVPGHPQRLGRSSPGYRGGHLGDQRGRPSGCTELPIDPLSPG
jgi:hypothetical protein